MKLPAAVDLASNDHAETFGNKAVSQIFEAVDPQRREARDNDQYDRDFNPAALWHGSESLLELTALTTSSSQRSGL